MWIGSKLGFFSIVKKDQPENWQVRARCEMDLRRLVEAARLPTHIVTTPQSEYPFCISVNARGLEQVFEVLSASVDYPSFKQCIDSLPHQRPKLEAYEDFCKGMRKLQEAMVSNPSLNSEAAESQMQRQVAKCYGGHLSRTLETLNGFKDKYGAWPTKLRLPPLALEALREQHLTASGFAALSSRLELIVGDYEALTAEDDAGLKFDYSKEGWSGKRAPKGADQWLWNVAL
jgi:hypothetical protein